MATTGDLDGMLAWAAVVGVAERLPGPDRAAFEHLLIRQQRFADSRAIDRAVGT